MNNTATRLQQAAWSKMETLSNTKRFIQNELEHSQSFLPTNSVEKLKQALSQIEQFNMKVFELIEQSKEASHPEGFEYQFELLNSQYDYLMQDVETIFG